MEIISGLINNNQKNQSAEEVISTLCDRLQHSRLASDRRAAILALKGFSRQYRESVVANGLRGLISTLSEFSLDTEILKACLETLLILFIRGEGDDDLTRNWISQQSRIQNGKYPSPLLLKEEMNSIDQFSLWIADEVTQDDNNFQVLISLLENSDFYVRLYTLQFLEALVSTRPTKAKESILNSPLGISSLVQVLNDTHDPVRNETVLLLMSIANDNFHIQKLIAFENTFDRLFEIIHEEGDIRGSIVVQDCLTLISNLLRYNNSNQKLFLETNCLPKLSFLISEPLGEEAILWNDQRLQNIIISLEIVGLFVTKGNNSTKRNQDSFYNANIFLYVLQLAFSEDTPNSLRPTALRTVALLINENQQVQSNFASLDVPYIDPSLPIQIQNYGGVVPVIIALLNWCLYLNSVHVFDIRVAAEYLLESYFNGSELNKAEFIDSQIKQFHSYEEEEEQTKEFETPEVPGTLETAHQDLETATESESSNSQNDDGTDLNSETPKTIISNPPTKPPPRANIFQSLLEYDPDIKLNPYKIWFSSVILLKLIDGNEELKSTVTAITFGDEEAGEEVISAIQAISGLLVTTIGNQDQRISIGYLMLLIVWLYEDFEAVNDFLTESSNIRAFLSYLSHDSNENVVVQGLISFLLGVSFEFSSKTSPLSRVDLHSLIVKGLGKDNYSFKILKFKESTTFVDFSEDDIFDPKKDETGLPKVFLHPNVVNLLKENFYRLKNTLNQDPTLESSGRISYEKFEQLQSTYQLLKKDHDLYLETSSKLLNDTKALLEKANSDVRELNLAHEKAATEISDLTSQNEALRSKSSLLASQLEKLQKEHEDLSASSSRQLKTIESSSSELSAKSQEIKDLKQQIENVLKKKTTAEDGINKMSRELMQLTRAKEEFESKVKSLEKDIKNHLKDKEKLQKNLKDSSEELNSVKSNVDHLNKEIKSLNASKSSSEKEIKYLKDEAVKNEKLIGQLTEKLRSLATSFNELTNEKTAVEEKISQSTADFSSQIQRLDEKVKELDSTNDDLVLLVDSLSQEKEDALLSVNRINEEYESRISILNSELTDLKQSNTKLNTDLETSNSFSVKYQSQISELAASLKSQKSELAQSQAEHAQALSTQRDSHTAIFNELKSTTTAESQKNETLLAELKGNLASAENKKTALQSEIQSNVKLLQESKNDLEKERANIVEIQSKLDSSNKEIANLQKELNDVTTQLASTKAEHQIELETSAEKVKQLNSTVSSLESELDNNAAEFESKESEFKKSVASLTEKHKSIHEEKSSLESTLQIISQTMEEKQKEYEILSTDFKLKVDELKSAKTELKKLEDEKGSLDKSFSEKEGQITSLTSEIAELKTAYDASKKNIQKKEQQVTILEKKLSDQKTKMEENTNDFKGQIESLKSIIDIKSDEFEKERLMLTENSSSSTKEYLEKVTKLEEQLKTLEKKSSVQINVLEKQKTQLEEKSETLKEENTNLADDLSAKLATIRTLQTSLEQNEKSIELLTKQSEDLKESLTDFSKLNELSDSLKKEKESATEELRSTKEEREKLQKVINTDSEKFKHLEAKLKSDISKLEESLLDAKSNSIKCTSIIEDLSNTIQSLEQKLADSETSSKSHAAEKDSLIAQTKLDLENKSKLLQTLELKQKEKEEEFKILTSQKAKLESSLKDSEVSHSQTLDEIKLKLNKSTEENKTLIEEVDSLAQLQEENNKLKKELKIIEKSAKSSNDLENENKKLRDELAKLKSDTVPRSELDDMMLVLDDLDEKKNSYKAKLKKLGGDVSSDEEDEDDDDE